MALINMKCKSCGAALEIRDGYCRCDYCGSVYFRSVSDSPLAEAETLSLEEFEKRVEKDSSTICVNCAEGTMSDADADLIKSKIKAADKALQSFELYRIKDILSGVPADNFSAARILFLSAVGVRNETELCLYAGDLGKFKEYGEYLSLCDDGTKDTYRAIEEKCVKNAETLSLIKKGYEYIKIKEYGDGLDYAKKLVADHPYSARAWELLITAKIYADKDYDPSGDLKKLEACPDFALIAGNAPRDVNGVPTDLSPTIRERCRQVGSVRRTKSQFVLKNLIKPFLVLVGIGLLIAIWQIIVRIVS